MSAGDHHGWMVEALERYLTLKRRSTLTGSSLYKKKMPKTVNGVMPDLEGVDSFSGHPVYGLAKECEMFADTLTQNQLEVLSNVNNGSVFMVVPEACYPDARKYVRARFAGRNITVLPYRATEPPPQGDPT